jgi:hypothetical protein
MAITKLENQLGGDNSMIQWDYINCPNQKAGCCGLQSCRLCGAQPGLVGLDCPECELCFIDPDNVI